MNNFKLIIIGSGTMMPTKTRHPSCYLLEVGRKKILLDLGHTSIARLVDLGIDLHSIDILFFSHFHTDHFADFLPYVHSRCVDNMYSKKENSPLTIIGPESIEERWKKLREVFWIEPNETYPLTFFAGVQTIRFDEIEIQLFAVSHVRWFQSLGIKINFQDKSFVYTGDIGGNHDLQSLEKIAQNADLLLIEAGSIEPSPNHLTTDRIVELVDGAKIKKTIATHLRDENLPILEERIKGHDNIILAEDLMQIEI